MVEVGVVLCKKKRQQKRNSPTDGDDAPLDSVTGSVTGSVTRERDELESSAQTKVSTLEGIAARKGVACFEHHPLLVPVVTHVTIDCCFRCSSVPNSRCCVGLLHSLRTVWFAGVVWKHFQVVTTSTTREYSVPHHQKAVRTWMLRDWPSQRCHHVQDESSG